MKKQNHIWAITYSFILIAFTLYVVLDTFVITRVYTVIPDEGTYSDRTQNESSKLNEENESNKVDTENEENLDNNTTDITPTIEPQEPVITSTSYLDEAIQISINEYQQNNTTIYVADIVVSSSEYLKTAFAQNAYGKNVTDSTSDIAENVDAILAINGDYYGSRETGYVIRNGVIYRSKRNSSSEDLVIYEDGSFEIISEAELSAEELLNKGAVQVLAFGPALVLDNNIAVTSNEEVGKAMTDNPRTAIGIIDDLHYVFVVSDGRTTESEGLTLYELAQFMQELGVETAYNLDGGGSSTMVFLGEVINQPTTNGRTIKERSVSDIVYIGY